MNLGIFGDQRFLYDGNRNYFTKGNLRSALLEEYVKHFDKIYMFFRTKHSDLSGIPKEDIIRNSKIEFVHLPTFQGPLGFWRHRKHIARVVEANIDKCDVCILRFCYRISCLAAPIARHHSKPTIAHLRGDGRTALMYHVEKIPIWLVRWLIAQAEWRRNYFAVNLCDRVIGTSEAVAKTYAANGRETMAIVDGGTTKDFFLPFRARSAKEPMNLIVVARIIYAKNLQQIFYAIAKLHHKRIPCRLTIVGEGPYLDKLKLLAKELEISNITHFVGAVYSRAELIEYYKGAHIAALTSRTEGLPSSILESMAASLPVVCSNLPCMREIVVDGQNGFLVNLDDVEACADRFSRLILDERLREQMGKKAHTTASFFRTDRQVNKLVKLVNEIVESRPNTRRK
jgi:glycosyltransferase involved in cell wall biosynthesis